MKKNWTMRVALLVVALTLITSCFVGGTFAKYVTGASYEDTARVAKFGVLLSIDGEGFATEYAKDDSSYTIGEVTVQAKDKVVAPGTPAGLKDTATSAETTKAAADDSKVLTFGITGTPEVAVRIAIVFGKDFKDVVLPKGTYTDYTKLIAKPVDENIGDDTGADEQAPDEDEKKREGEAAEAAYGYYGTFTLTEDYHPIVYTLKEGENEIVSGTLEAIKTAIAEFATGKDYAPGTVFNTEFTLTWAWAFEQIVGEGEEAAADPIIDAADTFLGNVAAGGIVTADDLPEGVTLDDISTEINFDVTITVTQID